MSPPHSAGVRRCVLPTSQCFSTVASLLDVNSHDQSQSNGQIPYPSPSLYVFTVDMSAFYDDNDTDLDVKVRGHGVRACVGELSSDSIFHIR